ncbi:MAG: efflux RND transporter periplasmic adaptor subunit [Planctomycetales bacterium]|nr:efflux RND transporter periplasmic adaptor subunit [Planctomycetales bacterium]
MNRSTCNHWNYHVTANRHRIPALAWVAFVACTVCSWNAAGQEMSLADGIPGLLEAYRTVNLSSGESGVLMKIPVVEGQRVQAGEVIAQLDDALQATQLKIAERRMASTGELQAARAELRLRQLRLEKLSQMRAEGHAREEEVVRAKADFDVAFARVQSQEDEAAVRELEYLRAEQSLQRRAITSPIQGVVSRLDRQEGEFLSPVRPEIAQIVQADPVLAVFRVPLSEVDRIREGAAVPIQLDRGSATGTVKFVGVSIDSASQTVQVKVQLPNPAGRLRVGESCRLQLQGSTTGAPAQGS